MPYDQAYEPGFEDMPRRVPALGKLEGLTGFRPATSLDDIVDGVVAYFREKQDAGMAKTVTAAGAAGRTCGRIVRGLKIRDLLDRFIPGSGVRNTVCLAVE